MELVRLFTQIDRKDSSIAGGKGASLGEMIKAGIPVPEGFVVLANAFDYFIKKTNLYVEIDSILHKVKHEEVHTVEFASEEINALIMQAEIPEDIEKTILENHKRLKSKYVAVRSSATAEDSSTAAWAGQLDSYLNTTEKNLLENVKKCWASLFTPRAIVYRFEKNLHKEKISVAVVIQKMVNSEESGIAFSVHPVTQDYNQVIIEAGFGLGESIVSGQITPDSYVIEKQPRRIIDKKIVEQFKGLFRKEDCGNEWKELGDEGKEQVLTDKEILELSELILKIEKHYGFPCDIEWAREAEKFYIVQSRPITTLTDNINNNEENYKSSNYIRMFETTRMPFLINTIALEQYEPLKAMAILRNNLWTTYLPKESERKTLEEGIKLFESSSVFKEYQTEFESYKNRSITFFDSILKKSNPSKSEIEEYFSLIAELWKYYQKTEFFYVDGAYKKSKENKQITFNLRELEKIKNSGREHLNRLIFGSSSYLNKILLILSYQFSVSIDDLMFYSKAEVYSLFDKKKVEESILTQRKESYVFYSKNNNLEILQGSKATEFIKSFLVEESINEIKGTSAYKGKARGKARVLFYGPESFDKIPEMIKNMELGEILVTETTSPEIINACKKASAILTNQGGLLSHAAIISRELKIPCIVGLGNITHIIKTGDEIEVDSNKGLVRIIKKSLSDLKINPSDYMFLEHVPGGLPLDIVYANLGAIMAPKISGFGEDAGKMILIFEEGGYHLFIDKNKWPDAGRKILEYTIKNDENVNKWNKRVKAWINEIKEANSKYSNIKYNTLSNVELHHFLEEIIKFYMKVGINDKEIVTPNYGTNLIYKKIENVLKELKYDVNKTLPLILRASEKINLFEYETEIGKLALLCISEKIKSLNEELTNKNRKIKGKIKSILKEYGWLDASVTNPPKSIKNIIDDVNGLLIISEKLQNIIRERVKESEMKRKEKLDKLNEISAKASLKQKRVIKFGVESVEYGRIIVDELMKFIYYVRPVYDEIADRVGVSKDEVRFLHPKEIYNLLVGKLKKEERSKINERKKLSVCILGDNDYQIISGQEAIEMKEKFLLLTKGESDLLKGEIAFSNGKIKGEARLVKNVSELKKVNKGDILISSRTYPDLFPAMKKASAIIAELGGLLSHAAIVSRELHIPCIVGVRNAMSVIKDGDMLEVDSENGTIIILEKAK